MRIDVPKKSSDLMSTSKLLATDLKIYGPISDPVLDFRELQM